ncbi:MAG: hypothetical protein K0S54_1897 [Alphaproteobacteria bacterium]|nr:hypothetical protein [Alphaproteobacteria bacterium]
MMSAALRSTLERSKAETFFHVWKPFSAAFNARSRSAFEACATVPMVSPVAGLATSSVLLPWPCVQAPSMNSSVFG